MALPTILCSQARKSARDSSDPTDICAKTLKTCSADSVMEDRRTFLFVSPLSSCSTAAPNSPIVAAPEESMLSMCYQIGDDKPQTWAARANPAMLLEAEGLLRHSFLQDSEDDDEIFQGHALWSTPECLLRFPSLDGEDQEAEEEIFQGKPFWSTPAGLRSPSSIGNELEEDEEEDNEIFRGMPLWSYSGPSLEDLLQAEFEKTRP